MTKEEAIARIKDHKIVHKMNEPRAIYISEALDMAIKALEQDSKTEEVLKKIRAEIIEDCGYSKDYVGDFTYSTIKVATVLQILDKYKAESKEEDG